MSSHGTPRRYKHGPNENNEQGKGCRCTPCRKANTADTNLRRMAIDAGTRQPMADAEPVRTHVRQLMSAGLGYPRIAELADVSRESVNTLLYGKGKTPPSRKLTPKTARALLAVRSTQIPDSPKAWVPAVGSRRRAQALVAMGWPPKEIAARIGLSKAGLLVVIASGPGQRVSAGVARRMSETYDELWDVNPVSAGIPQRAADLARKWAVSCEFPSPLAWDDDRIDDPNAAPDLGEESAEPPRRGRPPIGDGIRKRCPDCVQTKLLDEFGRNRNRPDGRHGLCKPCQKVRRQDRVARSRAVAA